jgi:electron transfer flavoprotein alpha subunit
MRIAVLVKQIPAFEELSLGADGRLTRAGVDLEMNAYCRRAVSQGVELAAGAGDATVVVFTLGPPSAEEVLREAIAWGLDAAVDIRGVLVTDPAFAGSDTLATARALAAALETEGPFDLVLSGRESIDAETGQVGPQVAELLGLPFATGIRHVSMNGHLLELQCEHDDGSVWLEIDPPVVLSCAERLIDPCKMGSDARAAVPSARIRVLHAADLGGGPWGAAGSPTTVGDVRVHRVERDRHRCRGDSVEQVREAVGLLHARGMLEEPDEDAASIARVPTAHGSGPAVGVVLEPDRPRLGRELLGAAATLAAEVDGSVTAMTLEEPHAAVLGSWGADDVLALQGDVAEEDVARVVAAWAAGDGAWAILVPSTAWGREVAGRAAARLGAGLTGDAIDLEVVDGRLVTWKPAFGGQLVAAVRALSSVQMATVRAGVLPQLAPRTSTAKVRSLTIRPSGRVRVVRRTRDDALDVLAEARVVVGVGTGGLCPDDYPKLDPLLRVLGAELGATRKVTDQGWLPRSRQIGITGRNIAPSLYVALGTSGKFNHMVGVRRAGTVLAVNRDPDAPVFDAADIGITGETVEVSTLLAAEVARVKARVGT